MLPYFAGERSPIADPDARGMIAGLTLSHTRGDLYRAALEAAAYGVRHHMEVLRDADVSIEREAAVGGGAQHDRRPQNGSDVKGLAQQVPRRAGGAAHGDASVAPRPGHG